MKNLKFFLLLIIGFAFSNVQSQTFENPYDYIGVDHNEGMKFLLENLKSKPSNKTAKATIIGILKRKYKDSSTHSAFESFPDMPTNDELLLQIRNNCSESLYNEVVDVKNIILNGDNLNCNYSSSKSKSKKRLKLILSKK